MLVIIETISLFIQPVALAVRLTAIITAGQILIHLIGEATLVQISISTFTALITFIILTLLTILEFAVTILAPTPELGGCWPPTGICPLNPLEVPLLNTSMLLASGVSISWAHHSLMEGNRKHILQALFITITLGIYFTLLQASEYYKAPFTISGGVYRSTFFIATGFHGLHVIIGSTFLIVCFLCQLKFHFTNCSPTAPPLSNPNKQPKNSTHHGFAFNYWQLAWPASELKRDWRLLIYQSHLISSLLCLEGIILSLFILATLGILNSHFSQHNTSHLAGVHSLRSSTRVSLAIFFSDSLSAPLLVLTIWLLPVILVASQSHLLKEPLIRKKLYLTILIILQTFLIITFTTTELMLFYIIFEATLAPTLIIIAC
ncbi:hypothetical protein EI555_009832 [Monodon monoceros]|uniref:Cytochrome c oxidase subunit 3 n=1 Tax=Monodon monoceros TaxID=40151 RepID=A0A4U1EYB7_MONMO|nr:hypothetical protein EI555_009832 [Monodon monoceros]